MKVVLVHCALLALLLSLAACSGVAAQPPVTTPSGVEVASPTLPPVFPSGPGAPGTFEPAACPFILPDGYMQGQDVDCGYLFVQEDRNQGGERIIRLAVAIFHPPNGDSSSAPIIYLSGGPGASALEMIRYQFDVVFAPVVATGRDLIVFDQRGVGLSKPALDCPAFDEITLDLLDRQVDGRQIGEGEVVDLILESLQACRAELGKIADLSAYNSAASAADVEDLRQALGYEQVYLWGGSYGTRLALEVMRRYPEGLRGVVLEAVYPPDADLYLETPANFNRALELLFESCAANQVCSGAYPDLRRIFFQTVRRLDAQPVMGEVTNPFTGETYDAVMNGDNLLALVFQILYESKLRYLLPGLIYDANQEDFETLDRVRGALIGQLSVSSRGMMLSVQCHEEFPFSSQEDYQAELARFPEIASMYEYSIMGGLASPVCAVWNVGQADASANQPVYSHVPTLVMTGEFDPITPPEWGLRAAETLEQAFFFEYPGIGHGASAVDDCPRGMLIEFIEDPTTAPDGACIADMRRP